MNNVLSMQNLSREYTQGGGILQVLKSINFNIKQGEIVALVGPSGCGKTTLLQLAGLLDSPTHGEITIAGEAMQSANDVARTKARLRHIGFVYQFHHLLPEFSALENVMIPQMIAGFTIAGARAHATELLTSLQLEPRLHHRPAKLSGGEQQRVAIARALANDPSLLLADEPTGNLDASTAEEVFTMFLQLAKQQNLACLVATHNGELAARMDRIVRLEAGVLK